ncbi:MAG: response regulator [Betaproteobacteria bacterium]|nr:response regulator [Betaproteobacteria bacterium]
MDSDLPAPSAQRPAPSAPCPFRGTSAEPAAGAGHAVTQSGPLRWARQALLCLAWLLCGPLAAQPLAPSDLAVLVDASGTETIASVSAPSARARFRPAAGDGVNAGYTHDVHWLRFTVQAPSPGPWWLDVQPAVLDDLRLFEPVAEGFVERRSGDRQPIASRELDYRAFIFKLDLPDLGPRVFYLRIQTGGSLHARLSLWRPDDFRAAQSREFIGLGLYFGMTAMMCLLNLVLWVSLRESLFVWFSLYLLTHATVHFGYFGLTAQFLPGEGPALAGFWTALGMASAMSTMAIFNQRLLRIDFRNRLQVLPFRVQALLPWLLLPAWFAGHFQEVAPVALVCTSLFTVWSWVLVLRLCRLGSREGRWILLVQTIGLAGIFTRTMVLLGWLDGGLISLTVVIAPSFIAMLVLQSVLILRITSLRGERNQAQQTASQAAHEAAQLREAQAEQLRSQAQLRSTLARLRHAQVLGKIGNWERDLASGELTWSALMYQHFERDPSGPVPTRQVFKSLLTPASWRAKEAAIQLTQITGEPYVIEIELALPSGRQRWLESRGAAQRDAQGLVFKVHGTAQDITERRAAQAAKAEHLAEHLADQIASRSKSEFLARVSHELRTPLNAVLGFSQLLSLEDQVRASPALAEQVNAIHGAADHLKSMIDDVLDLALIQADGLSLVAEPSSVGPLAAECLSWLGVMAASRQVSLRISGQQLDWRVIADHRRLRQVLINLLSNAIKYNRVGGQVFNRLGAELSEVEGSGLGLSLARELAEAMGGRLKVRSEPGQGSVFTLWLPAVQDGAAFNRVATPTRRQATDAAGDDGLGDRGLALGPVLSDFVVLYVEDNRLNVLVMRHAFKRLEGVRLEVATDGGSGLALAQQLRPDLLLIDLNLPVLNGTELMRRLRADPALAGTPCVAVSANSLPTDIELALGAGFDDYITKPFAVDRVLDVVQRLRREAGMQRSGLQAELFDSVQ